MIARGSVSDEPDLGLRSSADFFNFIVLLDLSRAAETLLMSDDLVVPSDCIALAFEVNVTIAHLRHQNHHRWKIFKPSRAQCYKNVSQRDAQPVQTMSTHLLKNQIAIFYSNSVLF